MTNLAIILNMENHDRCLANVVKDLDGKVFNVLTKSTSGRHLKYCNRRLKTDGLSSKDGQVRLSLSPGGCIAWDLNIETVQLEFMANGDIRLLRFFLKTGKGKFMTITQNPI